MHLSQVLGAREVRRVLKNVWAHCSAEAVESAEREAEGGTTRAMLVNDNTTT
jgi:hypothetical protein